MEAQPQNIYELYNFTKLNQRRVLTELEHDEIL